MNIQCYSYYEVYKMSLTLTIPLVFYYNCFAPLALTISSQYNSRAWQNKNNFYILKTTHMIDLTIYCQICNAFKSQKWWGFNLKWRKLIREIWDFFEVLQIREIFQLYKRQTCIVGLVYSGGTINMAKKQCKKISISMDKLTDERSKRLKANTQIFFSASMITSKTARVRSSSLLRQSIMDSVERNVGANISIHQVKLLFNYLLI